MRLKSILPLFFLGLLSFVCDTQDKVYPRMQVPGYDAKLIFQDSFDNNLENWKKEGIGEVTLTLDGKAVLGLGEESQGMALWALKDINDDFQLEFELQIPSIHGFFITIICARGLNGEDVVDELPERSGNLEEYSKGNIRSYHISSHCFTSEGQQIPGSKMRKNPGHLLLSKSEIDPCTGSRNYYIDVVKTGNRIRYYVDDVLIHDFRDKGGFGPIYSGGKIGFWMGGKPEDFTVILDDIKVFKLKAQ